MMRVGRPALSMAAMGAFMDRFLARRRSVRPLVTCLVALPLALACAFASHAQDPEDAPTAVDPPETEYANGDAAIDPEILRGLPVVPRYPAFLPVTVNLSLPI